MRLALILAAVAFLLALMTFAALYMRQPCTQGGVGSTLDPVLMREGC